MAKPGQIEMGVGVDQAGNDDGMVIRLVGGSLAGAENGRDPAIPHDDGPAGDRSRVHGKYPPGR